MGKIYSDLPGDCDIMIVAKMHRRDAEALLAACDHDLVGKTLEEGGVKITISESFFGRETIEHDDLAILMKQATSINIFGEKTIKAALREGLVDEDSIMDVAGIPHVQVYYI